MKYLILNPRDLSTSNYLLPAQPVTDLIALNIFPSLDEGRCFYLQLPVEGF